MRRQDGADIGGEDSVKEGMNSRKFDDIVDIEHLTIDGEGVFDGATLDFEQIEIIDDLLIGGAFVCAFRLFVDVIARRGIAGDDFGPIVAKTEEESGACIVGIGEQIGDNSRFDRMIGDVFDARRSAQKSLDRGIFRSFGNMGHIDDVVGEFDFATWLRCEVIGEVDPARTRHAIEHEHFEQGNDIGTEPECLDEYGGIFDDFVAREGNATCFGEHGIEKAHRWRRLIELFANGQSF